ncbi:MAG: alpha/beta hydrolase [Myxococcales bacterium]|nr:alpha/beta hydrolase [Myxococcales bacterium]
MPINEETQALLNALAEQNVPSFSSMSPEDARALSNQVFQTPPERVVPVAHVVDGSFPGPAGDVPYRLYSPDPSKALPTMLHYHGGGWVIMNPDTHDDLCRQIVSRAGCNIISVDYRLAPEAAYPAAVDDCYAALCWAAENAKSLGVDASKLGVFGDSAGGNLAAAVALRAKNEGGPKLSCQVLSYPAVDAKLTQPSIDENAAGYLLEKSDMEYFYGHYVAKGTDLGDPYLSPIYAEKFEGLPQALVITAEFDPLRDEGEAYAKKLEAAGVPTTHKRFDGTIHGFLLFPHLLSQAREAFDLEAGFIKKALF